MSKHYGESMAAWERDQEERDWKRRCEKAIIENDRNKIMSLIEEGVENSYDSKMILKL